MAVYRSINTTLKPQSIPIGHGLRPSSPAISKQIGFVLGNQTFKVYQPMIIRGLIYNSHPVQPVLLHNKPLFASETMGWSGTVSGGTIELLREINLAGGSTSGGSFALELTFVIGGGSVSSGTFDVEIVSALADLACYVLGMDSKRTWQYTNYGFTGFGRFNGKLLAVKSDGIYDIETVATTDNATAIAASMEIETDFGAGHYKQFRSIYTQEDQVTATITPESGTAVAVTLSANEFRGLPRTLRDKSFIVKIESIAGSTKPLRRIEGEIDYLGRKGE